MATSDLTGALDEAGVSYELLSHAQQQPSRDERVATDVEEIVVPANPVQTQYVREDGTQRPLGRRTGGLVLASQR